jgi:DNA-binding transcriptional LysR family regulator
MEPGMQRPLNFRQIEAFRAVMLAGSVTGAGALMRISQPAVTRLIRGLEADLGLALFNRSGARIVPTDGGKRLYREVERHFAGAERIREAARAIREFDAGQLHIGAMLTLSTGCLPKAVNQFLKRHPSVTVSVHSDSSLNIVDMIDHGQLDLGLATVPADRRDVDHEPFAAVDAVCLMPRGHRLARKKVVRIADLDGERFVSLGSSSMLRLKVEEALQAAGVRPQVRLGTL